MAVTKTNEKKDGKQKYRVRINYTDSNGKYQQVERTAYGLAEANVMEQQLIAEYKDKRVTTSSRMTVNQLIAEYELYHSQETKKASHDSSMKNLRLRVVPFIGDVRLDKLTQPKLAEWKSIINQLKTAKGESLSLITKRNAYVALMGLLNYAMKMEYISKNPLKPLGTFKAVSGEECKEEMQFYTAEEFQKFIKAAESHCETVLDWNFYVFFSILFFMGLRKGECYGLTWRDIEGNIMHIRRSISQKTKDANGNDYVDSPKNHKKRDILIPQPLISILDAHKRRQQEAAPDQFNENYIVCGGEKLETRDTTVRNKSIQFATEAGVKAIRIHDFRHSHASFLINHNVNIAAISKRLGHKDISETVNLSYGHITRQPFLTISKIYHITC